MTFSKLEIMDIYQRRARRYDLTSRLYWLAGFPLDRYRRLAVRALNLKRGDTVVEIGCGTGANFKALHEAVGGEGCIVGVDASAEMLEQARRRIERHGWRNVEYYQGDAGDWSFPERVDGVLSTFALTLMPEYEDVLTRGADALTIGGRFVILDFREPGNWPRWLVRLWAWASRPFGVTLDLAERRPWLCMYSDFSPVRIRSLYFGLAYLAVGESPDGRESVSGEGLSGTRRITG